MIKDINKVILVDMDDTIENLLEAWCDAINAKHGTSYKAKNAKEWDITKFFKSLTEEQIFEPLIDKNFWSTVKPKEDAIKYLKKLKNNGYDIYVVTATDYRNLEPKISDHLNKYFPFIDAKHIITCHNKALLRGRFLIDDYIENLLGGVFEPILYTTHHNKEIDENKYGIKRVNNWKECYNYILSQEK